jgi:hypothetical protein
VIRNVGSANPIIVGDRSLGQGETAPLVAEARVRIGGYLLEVDEATSPNPVPMPSDEFTVSPQPVARGAVDDPFADLFESRQTGCVAASIVRCVVRADGGCTAAAALHDNPVCRSVRRAGTVAVAAGIACCAGPPAGRLRPVRDGTFHAASAHRRTERRVRPLRGSVAVFGTSLD